VTPVPTLMDMPINAVTHSAAVELVCASIAVGRGGMVLTPNIDILRQYLESDHLRTVFDRTDLLVADGMPLVVALRLQRTPVPERITGTDLLWALCGGAADAGLAVLLAGGRPGDAARAADRLRAELPDLKVQTHPCFVTPDTEAAELAVLERTVVEANPDVVFIGLPFLTQVAVMTELSRILPATWFVGVGSSFDLINGDRSRPPRWLQRLCLEWAWRLTRQPQMWRRYLVQDMPIAVRLVASALRTRWRRS
jgi:N-acetylglucosaminyldiphosphoundecaprenol N-acetyl-beta-D-mannosaminyltransferase